jgi:hypothetical protein
LSRCRFALSTTHLRPASAPPGRLPSDAFTLDSVKEGEVGRGKGEERTGHRGGKVALLSTPFSRFDHSSPDLALDWHSPFSSYAPVSTSPRNGRTTFEAPLPSLNSPVSLPSFLSTLTAFVGEGQRTSRPQSRRAPRAYPAFSPLIAANTAIPTCYPLTSTDLLAHPCRHAIHCQEPWSLPRHLSLLTTLLPAANSSR